MPVLEIKALPQKPGIDATAALKAACLAVAAAGKVAKDQVWGTWETLKPGHYAEGDHVADVQQETTHPPVVNLMAFEGRSPETVQAMILAAATTLARELNIAPGNVYLTYTEIKSGRVYTGGVIRTLQG